MGTFTSMQEETFPSIARQLSLVEPDLDILNFDPGGARLYIAPIIEFA